jgi:hypothetical protein
MYTDRNKYYTFMQFVRLLEISLIFARKAKWISTCAWLFLYNFLSKQSLLRQATDKLHSTGIATCLVSTVSTLRCGAQIPDVMSVGRLKFWRVAPNICESSEATSIQKTLLAPRALSSQIFKKSRHAVGPSPPGTEPTTATGYKTGCVPHAVQTCRTRPTLRPDGHMNQIPRSSSP